MPLLRRCVRLLLALVVVGTAGREASAQTPAERWTRALEAFDAADRAVPPVAGGVVFLGSSTIVNWDVLRAFPEVRAINRGVWSSSLVEAVDAGVMQGVESIPSGSLDVLSAIRAASREHVQHLHSCIWVCLPA